MTESMIERVAKAIAELPGDPSSLEIARAAIEAMRPWLDNSKVEIEDVAKDR